MLHSLSPGRVLDVACGTGFLTQHLRGEVVALDQSPRMVEIATARMPDARVIQAEIPPLTFCVSFHCNVPVRLTTASSFCQSEYV